MSIEANKRTVATMWTALSAKDWDTLSACLADDVHYEDVATDDSGARGPANVIRRLRIAFDHIDRHQHTVHHMACEGDLVFIDHTEVWTFKTGETATNHFATMHVMRNGKVVRWSDFWDVSSFVGQFPQWFVEEMTKHTEAEFAG